MRLRALPLLAALTSAAAFAVPASSASADALPGCISINGIAQIGCAPASTDPTTDPAPASDPAPAPSAAEKLCPGADLPATAANLAKMRTATICLVNHQRTIHGLKALKANGTLAGLSTAYATKMVTQGFFDHTAPDGTTFVSRIKHSSYLRGSIRRWSVGENIAWGDSTLATAGAIVDAWMHSPGHRANILDPSFTEMGMGLALGAPQAGTDPSAATYVNEFGQRLR